MCTNICHDADYIMRLNCATSVPQFSSDWHTIITLTNITFNNYDYMKTLIVNPVFLHGVDSLMCRSNAIFRWKHRYLFNTCFNVIVYVIRSLISPRLRLEI